jgi:hypothetical protein
MSITTVAKIRRSFRGPVLLLALILPGCHNAPFGHRSEAPAPGLHSPGPVLGASLEDIDARNRGDIAAHLGRPVAPGPATPAEVVAMTRAGIEPRFIICYINRSSEIQAVSAQDVIYMHDQGVDEHVIQAMLTPGSGDTRLEVARSMPPRTIIVADPYWPYYFPYPSPGPRYSIALGYGNRCY